MRNFFSLYFQLINFTNPAKLRIIFVLSLFLSLFIFSGCQTAPAPTTKTRPEQKKNIEEHLKNAETVKASLLKQLEHPKSVDETIRIKEHLDKLQNEIDLLKSGKDAPIPNNDEADGFKNVKDKKTYYGPLGWTVEITQWILEKLWIVHET